MTRQSRHSIAPLTLSDDAARMVARRADDANVRDVASAIRAAIAERIGAESAAMAAMVAVKPTAADGHSDGVRVRYVRAETTAAILSDVLAILEGIAETR